MQPYTLPDLAYDHGALEPYYSAEMLELHHDNWSIINRSDVADRCAHACHGN